MEFFFLHWWLSYPHTSSCPHVYMIFVQEPSDNCLWSKKIMCAMQFCSTWRSVLHLKTKLLIMWSKVKFTICAAIYADLTQYPFGRSLRSFVWSKKPTQKYCLLRKNYKYHVWSYPHILISSYLHILLSSPAVLINRLGHFRVLTGHGMAGL